MISGESTVVNLAPLGTLQVGEVRNARSIANQLQTSFQYEWFPKPLKLDPDFPALPNGGFDLEQAAETLLADVPLPRPLILLTSLPLSAPEHAADPEGLLFSTGSFGDSDLVVVSTYLWEKLPGRKSLQSYLLLMMAGYALQLCSKLAFYQEALGCFFDSCDAAPDILKVFEGYGLCENCELQLETKIRKGSLRLEYVASAKKLFNRAGGKKVCFMAMPFEENLQPVYDLIAETLTQKNWTIVRADELARPRRIIDRILLSILSSDLILADLTGNNPNVFYELGLAHAVGADVILLTQENQLPFDVNAEQTIFYKTSDQELKKLARQLGRLAGRGAW